MQRGRPVAASAQPTSIDERTDIDERTRDGSMSKQVAGDIEAGPKDDVYWWYRALKASCEAANRTWDNEAHEPGQERHEPGEPPSRVELEQMIRELNRLREVDGLRPLPDWDDENLRFPDKVPGEVDRKHHRYPHPPGSISHPHRMCHYTGFCTPQY